MKIFDQSLDAVAVVRSLHAAVVFGVVVFGVVVVISLWWVVVVVVVVAASASAAVAVAVAVAMKEIPRQIQSWVKKLNF